MTHHRLLSLVPLAALACAHGAGAYVWVDALPEDGAGGEYVIAPGDLLSIRIWDQPTLSGKARVRSDGRISLEFLDDVDAAGVVPSALARRLELSLAAYVHHPRVTVAVDTPLPLRVSVLGEVEKPGVYELDGGAGVLQALASAGGRTRYAHDDRVFVLRPGVGPGRRELRIRFSYLRLVRAEGRAAGFLLRPGDTLVVE